MKLAHANRFQIVIASTNADEERNLQLCRTIGLLSPGWVSLQERINPDECCSLFSVALRLARVAPDEQSIADMVAAVMELAEPITRRVALLCALEVYRQQPFRPLEATILQLRAALETGKVTSEELIAWHLARIAAYDDVGPSLRSMLYMNPAALAQARALDDERHRTGSRSLLHGIPVVLKDNIGTISMPTTCGIPALSMFVPSDDAEVVKRLVNSGAVILGKTNLHELALFGTTFSTIGGQTRNPYHLGKTPGGSSGGTAAAVSANFAVVGLGTDAVNSVRSPASATNLVGVRPTKGLINLAGIIPVSSTQDNVGPIARSVPDAAITLGAMIDSPDGYLDALNSSVTGMRIGILRSFCGNGPLHETVNVAVVSAVAVFCTLGVQVVEGVLPTLDSDALLRELDVQRFEVRDELEAYLSTYGAPVCSIEELLADGRFQISTQGFLSTVASIRSPRTDVAYHCRLERIARLREGVLAEMDRYELDALVYPHQKRLVVDIGESNQADRNGILAAVTGLPAITFPGGFSSPSDAAPMGVPIGLELLGRPFAERTLFALASAFERATDHRSLPPFTPSL